MNFGWNCTSSCAHLSKFKRARGVVVSGGGVIAPRVVASKKRSILISCEAIASSVVERGNRSRPQQYSSVFSSFHWRNGSFYLSILC